MAAVAAPVVKVTECGMEIPAFCFYFLPHFRGGEGGGIKIPKQEEKRNEKMKKKNEEEESKGEKSKTVRGKCSTV